MKADEIAKCIESFAPIFNQEKWDNCGFCVGDKNAEVRGVLIALDCTESVLEEALYRGCNMIVTHHPLIFGGIKNISPENFTGRIIEKAIKNDIIIYSAHTNMDKASGGVSSLMADKLGLINCEPLSEEGFGLIGELNEAIEPNLFILKIREVYSTSFVRCSKIISEKIKKVAVCGGSGKFLINNAISRGAQLYISGDFTYHDFYCEQGFMLADIGHYNSEFDVTRLMQKLICKKFPNFAVSISEKNYNPIYYY